MEEELAKESDQRGSYSKKDHNSRIKLPFLVIMTKDIDKLHQGISEDTDRFRLLKYSRE